MTTLSCNDLVDLYSRWVVDSLDASEVNGGCRIVTPFLDRHRDHIEVYVERSPSGGLLLSDDAATVNDLYTSGFSLSGERRNEEFNSILRRFGIRREENELVVEATPETFAQRKHDLLQAILAVSDLHIMAQSTIAAAFADDVGSYLYDHGIRAVPDVKLTGLSGLDESFDFAIPRSATRPERIIKVIPDPSRPNFVSLMFAWQDVQNARGLDARAYAIINDRERAPSAEHLAALEKYEIAPVRWTRIDTSMDEFTG